VTDVIESPVRAVASPPDRLSEYRRLAARVAAARGHRDAELVAADEAYAAGVAAAAEARSAAASAAAAADGRAAAAASAVVAVDAEAERLWDELRRTLGWRASGLARGFAGLGWSTPGFGQVPSPAEAAPGDTPEDLLTRAAAHVAALHPDAPRRPLPWLVLPLLPLLGAASATVAGLLAGGLVTVGQGGTGVHLTLRLAGYVAFLLAPFTGVPVARALAERRFGSRLDTGAIGLIVFGGMVAGCGISVALR